MLALQVEELSAVEGGIILMIILLIATAVVFSVKFALDIALNKKLSARDEQLPRQDTPTLYAIRGNTPPKRRRAGGYTIVPGDKLFILENPSERRRREQGR
ncbi:MAG: hypothetical protein GX304_02485 [Clostridiales bacterium]|jgi:hypothetical protein|nr:hypothetical protein [Clostridiales bacterium]